MYAFERGSSGALETSWFQAVWFAAERAEAGPWKAGKTRQPPTFGGSAACANAVPSPRPQMARLAAPIHRRRFR